MQVNKTQSITIIGAGLAGSLLSIFLAKKGFDVTVFEIRSDMRKTNIPGGRSINLALAKRGIVALEAAGVFSTIKPLMLTMQGRMIHDNQGKQNLQPYGKNDEEVIYSIHRGKLNIELLNAAEATGKVKFYFNTHIQSIDLKTRTIILDEAGENKEFISNGPIIGTDGAGSIVRKMMEQQNNISSTMDMLDHGYKELTIPTINDDFAMNPNALHIWPREAFMLIALPNPDQTFTTTLFLTKQGTPGFNQLISKDKINDFFQQYFPDAIKLIPNLTDEFLANPVGDLGTIRTKTWHNENTLIIGDAAHAVVPFHGQGMNCAFEDCLEINHQLENNHHETWKKLFATVEQNRKLNANAIADMALENYIEMRDSVTKPDYLMFRIIEKQLEQAFSNYFIPRYSMVMFHTLPYAEAKKRGQIQAEIIQQLMQNDPFDTKLAEKLIAEKLTPFSEITNSV